MTAATGLTVRPPGETKAPVGPDTSQSIDLYWLPLGAGGHSVRLNGRVFEAIQATRERRSRQALYHAALEVRSSAGRFVIEVTPAAAAGAERGVVSEGAVGSRSLGRFRLFRYELRRWKDGVIPDVDEAVSSPLRLTDDSNAVKSMLELVPLVPTSVWGRDELRAGEMWTSNSVVSWLIERSGIEVESVRLPAGGRAPGWAAGVETARRETQREQQRERAFAVVLSCASRSVASGEPVSETAEQRSPTSLAIP